MQRVGAGKESWRFRGSSRGAKRAKDMGASQGVVAAGGVEAGVGSAVLGCGVGSGCWQWWCGVWLPWSGIADVVGNGSHAHVAGCHSMFFGVIAAGCAVDNGGAGNAGSAVADGESVAGSAVVVLAALLIEMV
eukprot:4623325-Lingulodinium_polyedra.AAC.2